MEAIFVKKKKISIRKSILEKPVREQKKKEKKNVADKITDYP